MLKAYAKERKAYTDKQRCARVKECQSAPVSKLSRYSGDNSTQLRTMKDVESNRLEEGHTFASRDIMNLCIAEEANLRCIKMKVERSDSTHFVVLGIKFYVSGTYSETCGWKANTVVCRDGDDLLKIPPNAWNENMDEEISRIRTLFKSKWLSPIILSAVLDSPGFSYVTLREILKQYGNNYALTDSILQLGRDIAKNQLFGKAEVNVKYAEAVAGRMRALGHEVKLIFATRREVLTAVSSIVLSEELCK